MPNWAQILSIHICVLCYDLPATLQYVRLINLNTIDNRIELKDVAHIVKFLCTRRCLCVRKYCRIISIDNDKSV